MPELQNTRIVVFTVAARRCPQGSRFGAGFSLVEMLVAVAIGAVLIAALNGVVGQALAIRDAVHEKNLLALQARFAMQRMVRAVGNTRLLLLPMNDSPASNWPENIREETVPPSPPVGTSTKATAVLAVTLALYSDLNADGYPDADDDKDGRVDEDLSSDRSNDSSPGIYLIDDDGDGNVDEGSSINDDDEVTSIANEDPIDGIDNDADHNIDEDPAADNNGDGCPGICGVDDDGDGVIDEGAMDDDDESGIVSEDWYNPVVFYLDAGILKERTPVPWDENGVSGVTGRDFITSAIADNVTRLRVERISQGSDRLPSVDLTLELTSPVTGERVSLNTRIRVGGAL